MAVLESQLMLMRELLVIRVKGAHYGVWKDSVHSVKDIQTLHRIPLAPACIAGMSILDGHTVTFADLSACIGCAPGLGNGKGSILVLSGQENIAGFMVNEDIGSLSVPPEAVAPLPECVKTDVIHSCVIHNGAPIPLIDVLRLHSRMLKDQSPPRPSFTDLCANPVDISALSSARVFSLGDELYARPSSGLEQQTMIPARIAEIPLVPEFVRGVACHEEGILPVVDLSLRIRRKKAGAGSRMLIQKINGAAFGLLIGEDRGTVPASGFKIASLPPVAGPSWLTHALLVAGKVIPLVDPSLLLSLNAEVAEERRREAMYKPDSQFPRLFMKQDVEVVEFSLLGSRHALPKSEVEDIIDFKPYRSVPDAPPIVVGVAEQNGQLLPVLDLALVFGRRSLAVPEWRMMLVKNGDFRALVITESVYGERRLPLDIQRNIPIRLPHRVVYGCYPDADTVRLILNVESTAVHFEKALVQELLPAMPQEMKLAAAEIVHSLLDEQAVTALEFEAAEPMRHVPAYPEQAAPDLTEVGGLMQKTEAKAETTSYTIQQEPEHEEEITVKTEEQQAAASVFRSEERGKSEALQEDVVQPNVPAGAIPAGLEGTRVSEEEKGDMYAVAPEVVAEVPQEKIEEEPAKSEEIGSKQEAQSIEETAVNAGAAEAGVASRPVTGTGQDIASSFLQKEREQEVESVEPQPGPQAAFTLEPAPKTAPETTPKFPAAFQAAPQSAPSIEPVPAYEPESGPAKPDGPASIEFEARRIAEEKEPGKVRQQEPEWKPEHKPEKKPDEEQFTAVQKAVEEPAMQAVKMRRHAPSGTTWKGRIIVGLIAVVLAGMLYIVGISYKPGSVRQVQEKAPAKIEQVKTETKAFLVEKQEPSLVIEVPAAKPTTIDVYVVVKGDTLWGISKRFTGNPFNYPRIAGENRIANPDLIFPGQKITLKKKQQ